MSHLNLSILKHDGSSEVNTQENLEIDIEISINYTFLELIGQKGKILLLINNLRIAWHTKMLISFLLSQKTCCRPVFQDSRFYFQYHTSYIKKASKDKRQSKILRRRRKAKRGLKRPSPGNLSYTH